MISEQVVDRGGVPSGTEVEGARGDLPSNGDLELTSVTTHGWRVTDRRLPAHDPFRLLAFIERRGERFEVLQLGAGFEWHEFDSLLSALAHVVETAPVLSRQRSGGGRPWIV